MFEKFIYTVDTHTEGDPTRFLLFGIPFLKGKTMVDRVEEFSKKYDSIRQVLMREPRGHKDMFGAVITPPASEAAAFGVIFMDNDGYLNMCGHGIMAAATIGKKLGFIDVDVPEISIDTAAGPVKARYISLAGNAFEVEITSVPSFAYRVNESINLESIGPVSVDIGFGGNFFAFVRARDLGIDEQSPDVEKIRALGMRVKRTVNEKIRVSHPEMPHINTVDLVEITLSPSSEDVNCKTALVFGDGQIGRDPCATGTTAKMAIEHAKGNLKLNERYRKEGIIGTVYTGRLTEETKVGEFSAVVPVLSGNTYITGIHQFVVEDREPRKTGWLL